MSVQEHQKINSAVQPTTVKSEYASVGDLEMYYEIHGTGRPLVLLHGAFMSATIYPALAENCQVIAVDLQGHGRTADIDRPLTFEQMADDVATLLKQLKLEQTDIFGYSMGGKVGLAMAIRHTDLVRRLAIFGAAYKSFEESFPLDALKVFKEITPETFAPKDLKEPYEKMSPAPNWKALAVKILESMKGFKGFSPEQMKAIKAEVFIGAARKLLIRGGRRFHLMTGATDDGRQKAKSSRQSLLPSKTAHAQPARPFYNRCTLHLRRTSARQTQPAI